MVRKALFLFLCLVPSLSFAWFEECPESREDCELLTSNQDPFGQACLGRMYEQGLRGLEKNDIKAVEYYTLSADQNHPLGQALLGAMYEQGLGGLEKSDIKAVEYYTLSADQNHPLGQVLLGVMYERGRGGLEKSDIKAVEYYTLSANQNFSPGQAFLGEMYERGQGVEANIIEAVRLYQLALVQGLDYAETRLARLNLRNSASTAECPVCLESLRKNSILTSCSHGFHLKCIKDLKKCPICRAPIE